MVRTGDSVSRKHWSIRLIQEQGGQIRTREALKAGIHPRTLYQLRDEGVLLLCRVASTVWPMLHPSAARIS